MTTSYREQVARLRALQPPDHAGPVVLFAGGLERVFTCGRCLCQVAVGPCWEHIGDTFVCGGCLEGAGRVDFTPRQGDAVVTRHRGPAPSGEHSFVYPSVVESRKENA